MRFFYYIPVPPVYLVHIPYSIDIFNINIVTLDQLFVLKLIISSSIVTKSVLVRLYLIKIICEKEYVKSATVPLFLQKYEILKN